MQTKRKSFFFIPLLLAFCLTGCGFHLRGFYQTPAQFQHIYIQSETPYSQLVSEIKQEMQSIGVQVAPSKSKAHLVLDILDEDFTERLINISANTQIRTYQLNLSIEFQLETQKGKVLDGPRKVTTTSTYTTSDNQLLADDHVLGMQREEMTREAVYLIINRLHSIGVRKTLAKKQ